MPEDVLSRAPNRATATLSTSETQMERDPPSQAHSDSQTDRTDAPHSPSLGGQSRGPRLPKWLQPMQKK